MSYIVLKKIPDKPLVITGSSTTIVGMFARGWNESRQIKILLVKPNVSADVFLLMLGHNTDSYPLEVFITHQASDTSARIFIRSVLTDSARTCIKAVCRVEKGGAGTETYFSHQTLLLSESAVAQSVPALEILNDDVKAGHAAGISQLEEEKLYYLQSRGLTRVQAEELLIHSFFLGDSARVFPDDRRKLEKQVDAFLKNHPLQLQYA